MTLLAKMDAVQVHAAAAALAAGGATFTDVAVGFPSSRGRCVRVFYGGEREVEHFTDDRTLTSKLIAQAIIVRGYWPISESAAKRHRVMEGEMATFVSELRTRVLGDSQLGGASVDLNMSMTACEQIVLAGTKYSITDSEIVADFDEYPIAP